jgi:hypothetical protein
VGRGEGGGEKRQFSGSGSYRQLLRCSAGSEGPFQKKKETKVTSESEGEISRM